MVDLKAVSGLLAESQAHIKFAENVKTVAEAKEELKEAFALIYRLCAAIRS